ncbi:hypothetical protein N8I77_002918 [Diaporthe amygdali]|uniref:Uncharacterized protein n=1 Tax=Phomopsis amygdali TaxID=1214568 RepID=A0AAD9SJ58_PHOAM|nr:hypothetical protein N8I77_002918 [Diaporthe amygdali]
MARTRKGKRRFPFLSLPPEIRNKVYREVLHKKVAIKTLEQPALLLTNKQIRDEALLIHYAENKFIVAIHAQTVQAVQNFVDSQNASIMALIRCIYLQRGTSMFTLPPELRNEMYKIVMNDVYKGPELRCRPVADFSLRQPALAQVNHQLRREVLPMWYSGRSFGIRIYPRCLSQTDQVWHDFKTRFEAHTDGEDGSNFLSFIKCLEVELWHPIVKDDRCPIPLLNCNGIYLKFGHTGKLGYPGHQVSNASTD